LYPVAVLAPTSFKTFDESLRAALISKLKTAKFMQPNLWKQPNHSAWPAISCPSFFFSISECTLEPKRLQWTSEPLSQLGTLALSQLTSQLSILTSTITSAAGPSIILVLLNAIYSDLRRRTRRRPAIHAVTIGAGQACSTFLPPLMAHVVASSHYSAGINDDDAAS
jgi:hypothetical protein